MLEEGLCEKEGEAADGRPQGADEASENTHGDGQHQRECPERACGAEELQPQAERQQREGGEGDSGQPCEQPEGNGNARREFWKVIAIESPTESAKDGHGEEMCNQQGEPQGRLLCLAGDGGECGALSDVGKGDEDGCESHDGAHRPCSPLADEADDSAARDECDVI